MTTRRKWAAIPGLFALAAAAVVLSAYSGASSPRGRAPVQPVAFPHPVHVQTLQMNCLFCHFSADKAPNPGLPAVGTCMGCHLIIGPDRPAREGREAFRSEAIAELQRYANENRPIPWERIHRLPDYVQFPHMRHVQAGVTCQQCHGQVEEMERVFQAESLNMGWCVNCHVQNNVRYDCAVCHY